ncbi:MAG: PKD domain-containing protein, partial [bacterium]
MSVARNVFVHAVLLSSVATLTCAATGFATSWTEAPGAVVNSAGYVYSPNVSGDLHGFRLYSGTYPNLSSLLADCPENQVKDVLTTPPGSYTLEHFTFACPTNPATPDGAYVFAYTTDGIGYQPQWDSGYYINATRAGGTWTNTSVQASPGAFTLSGNGFCGLSNTRSVNLKWSVSSNATSYTVYRDGAVALTGSMILQDGLPAYIDFGLAAGTYTYFVRATNAAGSTDSNTISLIVPVCGGQPVANFSFTPLSPTAGQAVTFTDTSTSLPTSWAWSFGDSQFSTVQSPTHT